MCQKVNDFRVFFANIPEGIERGFEKTLKIAVLRGFTLDCSHRKKKRQKIFRFCPWKKPDFSRAPPQGGGRESGETIFPALPGKSMQSEGSPENRRFWREAPGPAAGGTPGVRRNDFPGFAGEIYAIEGVPRKS